MVPIGAGGPVEAVTIGHEEGAVAARLGATLGPVPIPAGAGPTEPQRSTSLGGQRIAVVQDGRLSLSIPVSLYASEKTLQLLSLVPGRGQQADGILLALWMDG